MIMTNKKGMNGDNFQANFDKHNIHSLDFQIIDLLGNFARACLATFFLSYMSTKHGVNLA